MPVEIAAVPETDKPLLWERFQAYALEMTQWDTHTPVDGVFEYPSFDLYWREANRWPFWAMVDGKRAAFALVHRTEECTAMAEFYSFPEFRRTGTALPFARAVIARFPGAWELTEYRSNVGAVAFWHRVIADYPFAESAYIGGSGKERLRQTFNVP